VPDSILIAAIYAPSPLNARWYELQKRFIETMTTEPYEFRVYLNGVERAGFDDADILEVSPINEGHAGALNRVFGHFAKREHPAYLVLDSDCFPVSKGWHDILRNQMRRFGKSFAAPVRTENLDLFPHPSAMFILPQAVRSGILNPALAPVKNLLGMEVDDVGGAMREHLDDLLPLMRTNMVNVHPVAAAIYHHLFYHHGAGSRHFAFRVLKKFGYYDHWYDERMEPQRQRRINDSLLRDPKGFIDSLMGRGGPGPKSAD
jgi:hypothetical protein